VLQRSVVASLKWLERHFICYLKREKEREIIIVILSCSAHVREIDQAASNA
jgi:hypothetical protein